MISSDPAASLRENFREWLLPQVFREAVRAINPWLTDRQLEDLRSQILRQPQLIGIQRGNPEANLQSASGCEWGNRRGGPGGAIDRFPASGSCHPYPCEPEACHCLGRSRHGRGWSSRCGGCRWHRQLQNRPIPQPEGISWIRNGKDPIDFLNAKKIRKLARLLTRQIKIGRRVGKDATGPA